MRAASIHLKGFRRFSDLTLQSVPSTARLVVVAGPNGCGKSSLFDGMLTYQRSKAGTDSSASDPLYYFRELPPGPHMRSAAQNIEMDFHGEMPKTADGWKRAVYVRSAYRNEPDFTLNAISSPGRALDQHRFQRMAENDAAVSQNYSTLMMGALHNLFTVAEPKMSVQDLRYQFIGRINRVLELVFDDLSLTSLGVPGESGSFHFTKGTVENFHYKNLSGGEKAGFDLIIDLVAKGPIYNDTIFCIDEPEAHLNTKVQARLIRALFDLIPTNCQLWIATHAIGMMRAARDLFFEKPGEVCFLDFGGRNFDETQLIEPIEPTAAFWRGVLGVALDDLSSLVAPDQIVVCEGTPTVSGKPAGHADNDARCYNAIFAATRPNVLFVSGGNSHDVSTDRHVLVSGLRSVVEGAVVKRLIDRDDQSDEEVLEYKARGIQVLRYRHLESYLWSEEILTRLCEQAGKPELIDAVLGERHRVLNELPTTQRPVDDVKSGSGRIYNAVKLLLGLSQAGSNAREFMRIRLAPLVTPDTKTYAELDADIFSC